MAQTSSLSTVSSWGCGGGIGGCDDTVLPRAVFLPPPLPLLHEKPIHSLGLPSSRVCCVLAFLRVITCFLKVDKLGGEGEPKFSYLLPGSQPELGTAALPQKLDQAFP